MPSKIYNNRKLIKHNHIKRCHTVIKCSEVLAVGNMAIAEMTQTVKVVIDGNRLVIVIDDGNRLVGYGARTRELAEEAR
jgi:hypothetical protein